MAEVWQNYPRPNCSILAMTQSFKVSKLQSFKVRSLSQGVSELESCNSGIQLHWPLRFLKQSKEMSNFEQSPAHRETNV
jgi:hypothetical protein